MRDGLPCSASALPEWAVPARLHVTGRVFKALAQVGWLQAAAALLLERRLQVLGSAEQGGGCCDWPGPARPAAEAALPARPASLATMGRAG